MNFFSAGLQRRHWRWVAYTADMKVNPGLQLRFPIFLSIGLVFAEQICGQRFTCCRADPYYHFLRVSLRIGRVPTSLNTTHELQGRLYLLMILSPCGIVDAALFR